MVGLSGGRPARSNEYADRVACSPRNPAAKEPTDVPGNPQAVVEEERVGCVQPKVGRQVPSDRPPYHEDQWPGQGGGIPRVWY